MFSKIFERENREEEEPNKRKGKLVVGTSSGTYRDEREVRTKESGGEGIKEKEAEFSDHYVP